ncbi:MAG: D-2-hydroxyacid dehydrogenase [Oligosphaeraceae bacterium]|nr:D-2-hydroxyacid dehydrogenase [Oligosphaeraceae bacterium]
MHKIVVLDGYVANPGDFSWGPLQDMGDCQVYERTGSRAELLERAAGAEVILTDKVPISAEVLAVLPDLRFVSVLATGYNIVDVPACRRHGVVVSNVPNYSTESVAQHTFALLLQMLNHTDEYTREVAGGAWSRSRDFTLFLSPIREISGMTLGIIGYGAIGQAVARIARSFGMKVLVVTRTPKEDPAVSFCSLEELLRQSDVVSLHCPQTAETTRIINASNIALMQPGALLLNTARGGLVDEEALAQALNSGRLSGAALDVLCSEPPAAENPLLQARNCHITPHVAWAGLGARRRLMEITFANVRAYLEGRPINVVSA